MVSELYIDNRSILATYGLRLGENSAASFIEWPSLKKVYYNDWHEEDGIEPDLSNPVLDTHYCNLLFVGTTSADSVDAFIAALSDGAYHTFSLRSRIFEQTLRLVKCVSVNRVDNLWFIELRFSKDYPEELLLRNPFEPLSPDNRYVIDGVMVSNWGVRILEGVNNELLRIGDVKENLLQSLDGDNGVKYDSVGVYFRERNVRIPCLIRASTIPKLCDNYCGLLSKVILPGAHTLIATDLGCRYSFYYKSCKVRRAFLDAKPWIELDITITVFKNPTNITTNELDDIQ